MNGQPEIIFQKILFYYSISTLTGMKRVQDETVHLNTVTLTAGTDFNLVLAL